MPPTPFGLWGSNQPPFPKPIFRNSSQQATVHRINLNQEGLEVLGANGEVTDRIVWDRVSVVSVADVPLDLVRHYVPDRTSIRAAPHSKPFVTDTAKYTGAEMWIVCEDPFRALRGSTTAK